MNTLFKNMGRIASVICTALVFGGCGGTGSSGTSDKDTSRNVNLSYHLKGVAGLLINNIMASSTPQQVQIQVGSSTRMISNVVVGVDTAGGTFVTILSEGSTILNTSISDVSQGATVGGTSIHVPISAGGILQASVLGAATTPNQAVIKTPAATWQGISLPNGINVLLISGSSGDLDVNVNGSVIVNNTQTKSGTAAVSVTAPSVSQTQVNFSGGSGFLMLGGTQTIAGTTTYTASWNGVGAASTYTTASIGAAFN